MKFGSLTTQSQKSSSFIEILNNKDFSVSQEVFIADAQWDEVYRYIESKYGQDRAINASVLIWIDIYEQIMYYNKYLQFVDNQEQFVYDKFLEYTGGN